MQYEQITEEAPPDAGALESFLTGYDVVIGDGGIWDLGKLKDGEGVVIGWRAEIDAPENDVLTAMASWAAPVDPTPALEDALATVLAAILAIPEGNRTLAERAALIYATMLRPDLLVPTP